MKAYKKRIETIEKRVPVDDDDTIVIIRLTWGDEDDHLENMPVSLRRGRGGHLIRKIGIDTVPGHLRSRAVIVQHEGE